MARTKIINVNLKLHLNSKSIYSIKTTINKYLWKYINIQHKYSCKVITHHIFFMPSTRGTSTSSQYEKALSAAFPCPFWAVALFGLTPVLLLLSRVLYILTQASSDSNSDSSKNQAIIELRTLLLISCGLSCVGYFLTSAIVPGIAQRLLQHVPGLSGIDIGKRGLKGPDDGKSVAESLGERAFYCTNSSTILFSAVL